MRFHNKHFPQIWMVIAIKTVFRFRAHGEKLCYNTNPNMALRRFNSKTFATSKYKAKKTQATGSA